MKGRIMKVLVLGGVAAGTKAAAKIKREDRSIDVKIITKGKDISYAGCGLPYYISNVIENRSDLIVNTPAKFTSLTGVEVVTEAVVTSVDFDKKFVTYVRGGRKESESYDKLVIATGAESIVPPVPGVDKEGVFTLRTPDDAEKIKRHASDGNAKYAVVVGAGFIGLEVAENFSMMGLDVTLIDMADSIMPNAFDKEMALWAQRQIEKRGTNVLLSTRLEEITGDDKVDGVKAGGKVIKADLVILALGVRPSTSFLSESGIEMEKGAIVVSENMESNIEGVYAAGDVALVKNRITGKRMYSAMGSTANISARILAGNIASKESIYPGALGTGVVKLSDDLNAGRTGLTEESAKKEGFEVVSVVAVTDDKAHYYEGSSFFVMKLIAEEKTHRILGFQVVGKGSVDKMTDIAVVAISKGMRIEEFNAMDFAYAPPFSTAISPFVQICMILGNKIKGEFETISPAEYLETKAEGYKVVDVLPEKGIPGALWIDLGKVDGPIKGLEKDEKLLLVCSRGKRGYFLQNRLKACGYRNTRVLEGGVTVNEVMVDCR